MRLKCVSAFTLVLPAVQALSYGFPYGVEKVRGVSIGGWLAIEPWVTPSLFTNAGDERVLDEWTFCEYQSKEKALKTLRDHWDTFITERDFAKIAAAGLNHVRLPIGYWMFDVAEGEPYIQGQLPYLRKAVEWSRKHGLKLFITLYGAPGSQSGYVNSGHFMDMPEWPFNQTYIDRTTAIVKRLASMFVNHTDVVSAIAPLNEPPGYFGDLVMSPVKKFLYDSYDNLRAIEGEKSGMSHDNDAFAIVISDAFQPLSYWNDFMPPPKYEGVIMSVYGYQVWADDAITLNQSQHNARACATPSVLASSSLWPLVGEWGASMNDCAMYMNGRGNGSRYDGSWPPGSTTYMGSCVGLTGKGGGFSEEYKISLRKFYETQVRAYEDGPIGWVYWNWKMENADEWSYEAGLEHGWIPKHPRDFKYPNLCN